MKAISNDANGVESTGGQGGGSGGALVEHVKGPWW